jgi:hypothetical protein
MSYAGSPDLSLDESSVKHDVSRNQSAFQQATHILSGRMKGFHVARMVAPKMVKNGVKSAS